MVLYTSLCKNLKLNKQSLIKTIVVLCVEKKVPLYSLQSTALTKHTHRLIIISIHSLFPVSMLLSIQFKTHAHTKCIHSLQHCSQNLFAMEIPTHTEIANLPNWHNFVSINNNNLSWFLLNSFSFVVQRKTLNIFFLQHVLLFAALLIGLIPENSTKSP